MSENLICPQCKIAYGYHDEGCPALMGSSAAISTPPASQESAGEALPPMTDRQMFNIAFNLSAEFGPEFTEANKEFALASIYEYRTVTPACYEKEMRRFDSERDNLLSDVRVSHATVATLTAQLAEAREQRDRLRDECERLRIELRSAKINAAHAASQLSHVKHEKDLLRCAVKHIAEADTSNKRVTVGALIHITQEALFDDAARQSHRENNEMAELAALSASGREGE